ncbi:MAG: serine hydrolase [Pseudodonghicola sp.]
MFFTTDPDWTRRCDAAAEEILSRFAPQGLTEDRFGLVALRDTGDTPIGYARNGDWQCYPCSVVKVFHLVHVLNALEAGRVAPHHDLDRAMHDMIAWSSNTATNYIIDLVTGTTGDTLLEPADFALWRDRREGLNRFFAALGWPEWQGCNITQKLMDDTRYGREAQYAGADSSYLNVLTPLVAARMFHELFAGDVPLGGEARARAQETLLRDRQSDKARLPHFQVGDYLGGGVPEAATIWSKAGRNSWTGDPRASYYKHDLIRIALPGQAPVILALMTQGKEICEDRPAAFPEMARILCAHLLEPVRA